MLTFNDKYNCTNIIIFLNSETLYKLYYDNLIFLQEHYKTLKKLAIKIKLLKFFIIHNC